MLRILPERGGQSRTHRGYVHGAPELVVEVSKATRYVDLGPKLADYEQAGVREYVVRALDPDEVYWFKQEGGSLVQVQPDADGLYRSAFLPGLWLDPDALIRGDTRRLRQVLDLGFATPEHAAFVAELAAGNTAS
jgi:Uma2 family endonuclease